MKINTITKNHLLKIAKKPHLIGNLLRYDKLSDLHSDWIHYIWDDDNEEHLLQAHRNSYKTTSLIIVGVIYYLLFHPDARIAIIRKTFTEAAKAVRVISLLFENEILLEIFEFAFGIRVKKVIDREGKILFNFKQTKTQELSIEAHGLDYGITGAHYDRIICDDVITLKDRISFAEREKTKEVLKELRTNIIENGKSINVIGTPWHRNDGWTLFNENNIKKFNIHKTKILSDVAIEDIRKRTLPSLFSINYLLEDMGDESALFKNPVFDNWRENVDCYMHLDAAFDGDHYCALTILGNIGDKYQIKGYVYSGNVKDWIDFILDKYKKYNCKWIAIENNADKGYTADKLFAAGLNVKKYNETMNKHLKISTIIYENWDRLIFDNNINEEYLEQILDYREGQEPDDAPDSLASILRFFTSKKSDKIKVSSAIRITDNVYY